MFEAGGTAQNAQVYEGISLRPGVYRICLEYETDTDLGAYCNVTDGTVFSGGLLSNAEHLYRNLNSTDFEMWLFEGTNALQVAVSYDGKGFLKTGNLTIVETKRLWTLLLTCLLFVWSLVCLGTAAWNYDRIYTISRERKQTVFWLAVIIIIASMPYLYGYIFTGADLTYHLHRIEGVKDGLLSGQFPVRLEPRWVYDHGYANAIFYCNTLLYFPAILRMLGFTVSASYNIYCIALNIATVCIAYFCFSKMLQDRNIGIVCSALYTLSVFRIYKLVITTAVGEGSAFTFLPLVLYGLYRIFTEDNDNPDYKTAWIPLAAGFTGLMQTHVLTCEVTALVTAVYCIFYITKLFRFKTFLELLKAAFASVLLSLWFLVPFLDYYLTQDMHIKFVSARRIQSSGLLPAHLLFHFWTTGMHTASDGQGLYYSHPVGIGLVLVLGLCMFGIQWFSNTLTEEGNTSTAFMKRTALTGAGLLLFSSSMFPWDKIQALHPVAAALVSSLQFPNRFLGWGSVCLVSVFGYCLNTFARRDRRLYLGMLLAALLGITTSGMYLLDQVCANQDYFELYNREGMGFGYISGREYLIEGTDDQKLTFSRPVAGEGVLLENYQKQFLGGTFTCVNIGEHDSFVDMPLLLYKGYQAADAGRGAEHPVIMQILKGENGSVRVRIPAGYSGEVTVQFVPPVYWRIAEGITLITALVFVFSAGKSRRKKQCVK